MSNFFPELEGVALTPHHAQHVIPRLSRPSTASSAAPFYSLTIVQNVIASDAAILAQALWTLWNNE